MYAQSCTCIYIQVDCIFYKITFKFFYDFFQKLITSYNFSEFMAACMRATCGVAESKFKKRRKSLSLDSIVENLSSETNP